MSQLFRALLAMNIDLVSVLVFLSFFSNASRVSVLAFLSIQAQPPSPPPGGSKPKNTEGVAQRAHGDLVKAILNSCLYCCAAERFPLPLFSRVDSTLVVPLRQSV